MSLIEELGGELQDEFWWYLSAWNQLCPTVGFPATDDNQVLSSYLGKFEF